MAESAGVTVERMNDVVQRLMAAYPGLKQFMRQIEEVGRMREKTEGQAYVITPMGRRLPADKDKVYTLVNYCVAPDTPILRSDLTHVPASSLSVGTRLVGFDENPVVNAEKTASGRTYSIRRWRTATVEAISVVTKPSMRITLSDGRSVECSDDHLWLGVHSNKAQPRTRWIQARELEPGRVLHSVGRPWEVDMTRDGGWLAGMYDGEGYLGSRNSGHATTTLVFSQLSGEVLDKFMRLMNDRNLPYKYMSPTPSSTSPTASCRTSSVPGIMRVLGSLQPERFKGRFESLYEGGALVGGSTELVTVTGVEHIGMKELVSVQTSTRTFIANGVLSHNCLQSTAADVLKNALIRLDAAGYDEWMLFPVHDEVAMDIPRDLADQAMTEVPGIMAEMEHSVPLTAASDGPLENWGQKYE